MQRRKTGVNDSLELRLERVSQFKVCLSALVLLVACVSVLAKLGIKPIRFDTQSAQSFE